MYSEGPPHSMYTSVSDSFVRHGDKLKANNQSIVHSGKKNKPAAMCAQGQVPMGTGFMNSLFCVQFVIGSHPEFAGQFVGIAPKIEPTLNGEIHSSDKAFMINLHNGQFVNKGKF